MVTLDATTLYFRTTCIPVQALEKHDDNMSGLISVNDFKSSMEKLGVTLSKSDCNRLVMRFDVEESNNLNVENFLEIVKTGGVRNDDGENDDDDDLLDDDSDDDGKKMKKTNKGEVKINVLMKKLKTKLQNAEEKGVSGKTSFEFFDKDGNGQLDESEFQQVSLETVSAFVTSRPTGEGGEANSALVNFLSKTNRYRSLLLTLFVSLSPSLTT